MGFVYERVNGKIPDPELSISEDAPEEGNLLRNSNIEQSKSSTRNVTRLLCSHKARIARGILIGLLALWGLFSIIQNIVLSTHHKPPPKHCYCGNSTAEAVSLSCKFDSLAVAWLPSYCRDEELTAEFERSGPGPNGSWTYFADDHHTIPMTIEEVAAFAGNQSAKVMMMREWHVVHCLFYWRKHFRVRF
ncbi:hypothetical protein BDV29DRAFT_189381 [Aspergillus leporis]|uniref:Uncharacterized protein n=1 Tax=Aspergillus leporis TaxID=41062 RepID=A0A5N5X6S3_9EURO|nr:hypothetical protein BDV29DRAFT_189381 [Aspergillus leporis]